MKNIPILLLSLIFAFCKDRYEIRVKSNQKQMIVIEGNLDNHDTTEIRLSTTSDVNGPSPLPVVNAIISVEGNNGNYTLFESPIGKYKGFLSNLQFGEKYRLRIKLASGLELLSDSIEFKKNPPIDSITWNRAN